MKTIKLLCIAGAALLVLNGCGGGGGSPGTTFPGNGNSGSGVSTGVPSQSKMSVALDKYNIDWLNFNDKIKITVRISDTAGNPVPAGTKVNFVTEGSTVVSQCVLAGRNVTNGAVTETLSECSVDFSPLSNAPIDGSATVLVYLEGEEAYNDLDGDRKFSAGDTYYEGGRLFRDDDDDGVYTPGVDMFTLSGAGAGSSACVKSTGIFNSEDLEPLSVDNTCDGKWGKTYVRAQVYIPVSYAQYVGIRDGGTRNNNRVVLSYSQAPGSAESAAVAGSTVSVVSVTGVVGCTGVTVVPATVPTNATGPYAHRLIPSPSALACAGAAVTVKIDSNGASADQKTITF